MRKKWLLVFMLAIGSIFTPLVVHGQLPAPALSTQGLEKRREQNEAFAKVVAEASPILKERLSKLETREASLLQQISNAERNKDTATAEKLAAQLGELDANVTRLHIAKFDLQRLNNANVMATNYLSRANANVEGGPGEPTGPSGPGGQSGQFCNGGRCTGGQDDFWFAIAVILTADLVEELSKKEPFGPNNEITKTLHAAGDFVQCVFQGCK